LTKKQSSKNENAPKNKRNITKLRLKKEVSITTTNSSKKRKRNENKKWLTKEANIKMNQSIKEKVKTNEN
jgi:hypothetical protein